MKSYLMYPNKLQIGATNSNHIVTIDNNIDVSNMELSFVTVLEWWCLRAFRIYNDICPCCGFIKQQIAQEINKPL